MQWVMPNIRTHFNFPEILVSSRFKFYEKKITARYYWQYLLMCLSNQDLDEKMQNCISNAKSLLNKRYWSVKNTNKILKKTHTH